MARPNKIGIDYFSFDVDLFEDEKVLPISCEFGAKGECILIRVLCAIYRNGYFAECSEAFKFKIANQIRVKEKLVNNVILCLVNYAFFDKELFAKYNIITSLKIQKIWLKNIISIPADLTTKYLLIPKEEIPFYKFNAKSRLINKDAKLWFSIRDEILKRDNYTCKYCGIRGGILEVDHIIPFSKGGGYSFDNLTTACRKCNRQKKDKSISEFLKWKDKHEENHTIFQP